MKKKGQLIRVILFIGVVIFAAQILTDTMIPKRADGITPMKAFYDQEPETVDVLVLGSSQAGMNLSVQTLWEEFGFASYVLWGSVQPFWNSYYNLIEALKYQTPKVVVLETYAATFQYEYSDDARQIANVEGMRLSKNKLNAIKVTSPKERWADMIALLPLVHDRYDELTENDFKYYSWNDLCRNKGSGEIRYSFGDSVPQENAKEITEVKPLHEKEEKYLRKIIDLCKGKDIPLLLFKTPVASPSSLQPYFNRVAEIAEECEIPYINCNLLESEMQLDRTRDFESDNSHLNTLGTRKATRCLGNYLKEHYTLPDRRGQSGFESWDDFSREKETQYIPMITGSEDYLSELSSRKYLYYIIKNSSWEISDAYKALETQFAKMGIGQDILEGGGGTWTLDATVEGETPISQFDGKMLNLCTASGVNFRTDFRAGNEGGTGEVAVNGEVVYHLRGPGIILVVYDPISQKCVDVADFLVANQFALARP